MSIASMKINFYSKSETPLFPEELNTLYDITGGNRNNQRSLSKTQAVLDLSPFYSYARNGKQLVGFGRLVIDPYFAIILDLCTHPDYRMGSSQNFPVKSKMAIKQFS